MEQKTKRQEQPKFDIRLLREVVATNPFEKGNLRKGSGWKYVAGEMTIFMGYVVTERRARERTLDLLTSFKENKHSLELLKSRIDEDNSELETLLTEVSAMKEIAEVNKATALDKKKDAREKKMKEIQEKAMEALTKRKFELDSETSESSPKKANSEADLLKPSQEKEERMQTLRMEKMAKINGDLALKKQKEEARERKEEQERELRQEELRVKERMAEADRSLKREEMTLVARREEEERKLRLEEMRLRDAREREAAERQASLFAQLLQTILDRK